MKRKVTEQDFRLPEFRDANPEDYEFRADGVLVRKDRWERGIYRIASVVGISSRGGFEIDQVVDAVQALFNATPLTACAENEHGDCAHPKCPQNLDDEPHSTGRGCPLDEANISLDLAQVQNDSQTLENSDAKI